MYFELDHSDEEEMERALDSECPPFIDPWYDIHPYFPKILGNYALSPPGCVWLALCW